MEKLFVKKKKAELIITVGYPAREEIRQKIRKPMDEIRSFNRY